MPIWKTLLLNLYYRASYPHRAWRNSQRAAAAMAPAMVLFYHRVADDGDRHWTTSNRVFAGQIHWLKKHFDMVSLAEAQERIRSGSNRRPCVTITFDDGYADNCTEALPLLIAERIPCTYFVTTGNIIRGTPFPHDLARGRPLAPNRPREIRWLSDAGIDIGAHSRTHADLGRLTDPDRLHDELVVARDELQDLIGRSVRYFAFPFGQHANLSPQAFELAERCGYDAVCSAYGGYNFPGDDPFHLQRIHGGDESLALKNWVTLDPRKVRSIRRFQYTSLKPTECTEAGLC